MTTRKTYQIRFWVVLGAERWEDGPVVQRIVTANEPVVNTNKRVIECVIEVPFEWWWKEAPVIHMEVIDDAPCPERGKASLLPKGKE